MKYTFNSVLNNIQSFNDKKLAKCEIVVCHDGLNYNNSEFDISDILRCAEKSLRYSPILGSIVKDEEGMDRLNGHDTELELIETSDGYEVEFRHIEKIYGFVPAEANIRVENINDRNYLITEGYIWKHYMDNLEGIFERNAGNVDVSMEIEVSDYSITSDGICKIKEFDFTGITMLGVAPAMEGANLQMSNFSMENLKTQMEELCKVYSLEVEGGDIVEERIEVMEEQQVEVCPECDKQPCECEVVEEVEVKEEVVEEIVEEVKEEAVEEVEEVVEEMAEVSEEAQEVQEVVEEMAEEVVEEVVEEVNEYQAKYEELREEYSKLVESYNQLEEKLNSMSDYEELRAFKLQYDEAVYNEQVEEVSQMFELTSDEIAEFKAKVLNKELSIEEYKKELALIFAMKQMANKKFAREEVKDSGIKVVSSEVEVDRPYGGKFDKYLKK